MNTQKRTSLAIISIIASAVLIAASLTIDAPKEQAAPTTHESTFQQIVVLVDQLPDGTAKANLYTVIAAEYGGTGAELQILLQEYAKMQLRQLQSGDTI